jgi:cytochrome c nitrite reductase small subunit
MNLVTGRWQLSQHKHFGCVECHLPDTHIVGQVFYKARAGINDLVHETLRTYPAEMRLSDKGGVTVNQNCLRCHISTAENTAMATGAANCLNCHRYIVHGRSVLYQFAASRTSDRAEAVKAFLEKH